jgi:hypothetical protein
MYGLGMYEFFPLFILEVGTTTDCHLQYEPIGHKTTLGQLDYAKSKFSRAPFATMTKAPSDLPAIIEPNDGTTDNNSIEAPIYASYWPKKQDLPLCLTSPNYHHSLTLSG